MLRLTRVVLFNPVGMKIKLTHKVVALVLLSNLGSAVAMVTVASRSVSTELQRQLREETERCVRHLGTAFVDNVPGASASLTDNEIGVRIVAPTLDDFHNDAIVDDNVKLLGGTASIFVFDKAKDNFIRAATSIKDGHDHRISGTPLALDSPAQIPLRHGQAYFGPTVIFGEPYYAIYLPTVDIHNRVDGVLYAGYPMRSIYYDGYANIMWRMGLVSLAVVSFLMILASVLGHHLFAPLSAITRRIDRLIQGDLASPTPDFPRTDEIGDIAASVALFRKALLTNEAANETTRQRTLGDLKRAETIIEATQTFEGAAVALMDGLSASVDAMDRAAHAVADSSHETQTEASIVWEAARDTTKVLDSVAFAGQELSRSATAIADQMRETSAVASSALHEATTTKDQVATLVVAAREIGGAARLIDEIAQQTNLLALNATIEAANAGESGRGFAVVAGEVKFLAKRTAEATNLIKHQIQMIQNTSDRTAQGIIAMKATLDHMNAISASVATASTRQGASSLEIADALTKATDQARIVLTSIHHVNATAVANGERALELQTTAAKHGEQAERLSGFISLFAGEMRETA